MQKKLLRTVSVIVFLVTAICMNVLAQDQSPVRIVFDTDAKRIDLMTGKQIPNYTQAKRGSIQFYLGRLDTPVNGFWYSFDGRRFQNVDDLVFMRKMPSIGGWAVQSTRGRGRQGQDQTSNTIPSTHPWQNVEVQHNVISFIPLDSNGRPQPKVYVLLNDLELIQRAPYDHWIVNDTQEQIRAKKGVVY